MAKAMKTEADLLQEMVDMQEADRDEWARWRDRMLLELAKGTKATAEVGQEVGLLRRLILFWFVLLPILAAGLMVLMRIWARD